MVSVKNYPELLEMSPGKLRMLRDMADDMMTQVLEACEVGGYAEAERTYYALMEENVTAIEKHVRKRYNPKAIAKAVVDAYDLALPLGRVPRRNIAKSIQILRDGTVRVLYEHGYLPPLYDEYGQEILESASDELSKTLPGAYLEPENDWVVSVAFDEPFERPRGKLRKARVRMRR